MTSKELKDKLNMVVVSGIINIANDQTIVHKAEQIQGLVFNALTDKYWDNTEDSEIVIK